MWLAIIVTMKAFFQVSKPARLDASTVSGLGHLRRIPQLHSLVDKSRLTKPIHSDRGHSSEYRRNLDALPYGKRLTGAVYLVDPRDEASIPSLLRVTVSKLQEN